MNDNVFREINKKISLMHDFKIDKSKPIDIKEWDKFYLKCIEIRNFEINNLVNRNNFFMIFQGVIIAGLFQSSGSSPPIIQFLGALVGLSVSWFQYRTASGAKYWQEIWEEELSEAEKRLHMLFEKHKKDSYFTKVFQKDEAKNKIYYDRRVVGRFDKIIIKKHSVSKTPIHTSIVFMCFWFFVLISTLHSDSSYVRYFCDYFFSFVTGFKK